MFVKSISKMLIKIIIIIIIIIMSDNIKIKNVPKFTQHLKFAPFVRWSIAKLAEAIYTICYSIHNPILVFLNLHTFMPHYNTSKFLDGLPNLNIPHLHKYQHMEEKKSTNIYKNGFLFIYPKNQHFKENEDFLWSL